MLLSFQRSSTSLLLCTLSKILISLENPEILQWKYPQAQATKFCHRLPFVPMHRRLTLPLSKLSASESKANPSTWASGANNLLHTGKVLQVKEAKRFLSKKTQECWAEDEEHTGDLPLPLLSWRQDQDVQRQRTSCLPSASSRLKILAYQFRQQHQGSRNRLFFL